MLDCETEVGRMTIEQEEFALAALCRHFPSFALAPRPGNAARTDRVLLDASTGNPSRVVEVKSRKDRTFAWIRQNGWKFSSSKIDAGIELGKQLGVPFAMLLFCWREGIIAVERVWCPRLGLSGNLGPPEPWITQLSVNDNVNRKLDECRPLALAAPPITVAVPSALIARWQSTEDWLADYDAVATVPRETRRAA